MKICQDGTAGKTKICQWQNSDLPAAETRSTGEEARKAGAGAAREKHQEIITKPVDVASERVTGGDGGGNNGRRGDYGAKRGVVMENLRCVPGLSWESVESLYAAGVPVDVVVEVSEQVREWGGRFPDSGRRVTPSAVLAMARRRGARVRGIVAEAERQGAEAERARGTKQRTGGAGAAGGVGAWSRGKGVLPRMEF